MSHCWLKILVVVSAVLLTGCSPKRAEAPSTGAYGVLAAEPVPDHFPAPPDSSATQPWTNGELAVLQTKLSPATLFHSTAKTLSFFTRMPETGLGGPTFAAISTQQGPKIFQPGEVIEPDRLRESWFVVWFAGATNWTNWDSPWFLTLQHRPKRIRFDSDGLHFTFTNEAGYAALMPMHGIYKPAQLAQQPLPIYMDVEKKKRVLTWEWFKALPADPLARARYWASALREFPVACEESFSVDRAHDRVTFREKIRWLSWNDDWNTEHLKLAPVSPVLALAFKEGLPAEFSKTPFDMEIPTSSGPYYGVQDADSYDVTLPVLRYVHETAGVGAAASGWSNAPCFDAWRRAHAGEWDAVRAQWEPLRREFKESARPDWTAFAKTEAPPLEQAANALGAARLAYRFGDADTYVAACAQFARTAVQLTAQQRGVEYFRARQPWRSMEPMKADVALGNISFDGWQVSDAAKSNTFAPFPDLARLWQDAQPEVRGAPPLKPSEKLERLIPAHPATVFLASDTSQIPQAGFGSVVQVEHPTPKPSWPQLSWQDWRTPTGVPWNFGRVTPATNDASSSGLLLLNANTRTLFYSGH